MDKDAEIKTLMKEADNVRAWFSKYSDELKNDPVNADFLRLQLLCRRESWLAHKFCGVSKRSPNSRAFILLWPRFTLLPHPKYEDVNIYNVGTMGKNFAISKSAYRFSRDLPCYSRFLERLACCCFGVAHLL